MKIYEQKQNLYNAYVKELDRYRLTPIHATDRQVEQWCNDYICETNCSWRNIFSEDGTLAGFLIIGKAGTEKHPDSNYAITQAYIAPKYRKQGLMTNAVSEYIHKHRGVYSLLVLEKNTVALQFWKNVFQKTGYQAVKLDDRFVNTEEEPDHLLLLGFAPQPEG